MAANLQALRTLRQLQDQSRAATPAEQTILARWSGWGAAPEIFDPDSTSHRPARQELAGLLSEAEWTAARRTTINAHYTSAEIVTLVWSTVRQIGFDPDAARVLEPGSGSGNFLGFAPAGVQLTGIELDPTTAAISAALYPHAAIRAESFAETRLPDGSFDLVIGNVPFGAVVLNDRAHNPHRHSIHNFFIIKSLDLVRPGGLVAVVTSRFTLDAAGEAARADMAARADLVGAVRLPSGTFRAAAGTDVITDVVVLRRRYPAAVSAGPAWQSIATVDTPDGPTNINEYFAAHPDMVAGDLRRSGGQYHAEDLNVVANSAKPIAEAFARIAERAAAQNLTYSPAPRRTPAIGPAAGTGDRDRLGGRVRKEGSIVATGTATFARVVAGELEAITPPKKAIAELRALTALRDTMVELLDVQARSDNDDAFAALQRQLGTLYDRYVAAHGPLGRFQMVRTGRTDPDTGTETERRLYPAMGGFRRDPDFPSILALETYDPETGTATKAAIFSTRVVGSRPARVHADTPAEALAICLDETGGVDLDRIAGLLGVDPEGARQALGSLVFDDPAGGPPQTSQRYLSGNVRIKLAAAAAAAAIDARFEANVAALTAVQPDDLTPGEIDARPGATWIPPSDVAAFVAETFEGTKAIVEHTPIDASWALQVPTWQRTSLLMTSTWGTNGADAVTLFAKSLNQTQHQVYDTDADGRRILNSEETLLAQEKQQLLSDRFAKWVWEDPERSARLAGRYNELFNSLVLPTWDGSHQTFPGLSPSFKPRPHQIDAVWRAVQEPSLLLGHVVGAGKTATMVMAVMEMRRLGLVQKPALAVPNHMLEQFTREFLQLYPQAKVLMATTEETRPDRRKQFVARCATGDWDAIIMTHSAFEKIPVSAETEASYLDTEIAEFRAAITASAEGSRLSVKQLETAVLKKEERLKALRDDTRRDDGVTFEATGVDHLCIDEAHLFKNLSFPTRIQGVAGGQAKRATDLDLKLQYLRARYGGRTAIFATATFVANSVAEMWVMQHYLQPELLTAAGVNHFDAWAATFGRTVSSLELSPDGNSYRIKDRFASFANVPELLAMFRAVADVKTDDQLGLPAPNLAGGRHETVVVAASANLRLYTKSLADRAAKLGRDTESAKVDNMLKITGDGRKAALDLRLVGVPPDPTGGKIAVAARHIADIYHQHKHRPYPEAGTRPGALQLVFCDLSTPGPGWNAYSELKERLVGHGVPVEAVRFVHDGSSDRQKADLFAEARSGAIAVLVGSTAKMGVGTNVQARAIALHHIDAPWRPADMEQRDGRILRQGNLNDTVTIKRYVTEGSFDTFMYQTLERKSRFINQVCRGELDIARTIDDVGEATLSLAEVKALSTGNPLIMEKAGIDNDVARLERLAASHAGETRRAAKVIADGDGRIARLLARLEPIEDALARRTSIAGDDFSATLDGQSFTKRTEAAAQLHAALAAARHRSGQLIPLGTMAGMDVAVHVTGVGGDALLEVGLPGLHVTPVRIEAREVRDLHPGGFLTRVTNMIAGLDTAAETLRHEIERTQADIATAGQIVAKPFDQADLLAGLKARQTEINQALLDLGNNNDTADPTHYPGPDATPEDWERFVDQAAPALHASPGDHHSDHSTPIAASTLTAMTTTELHRHATTTRSTLAAKQRAAAGASQAIQRLTRRLAEQPAERPDHPLSLSLGRQQADQTRLDAEIAALTAHLQDAQAELDRRPDWPMSTVDPPHQPTRQAPPAQPSPTRSRPIPGPAHTAAHQPPRIVPTI